LWSAKDSYWSFELSEIDAVADRYVAAVYDKDEAAFLALYDEEVVVFDMWDQWSCKGREAWSGMVKSWFGSHGNESVRVIFTCEMCVVDDDWAVWCGIVRYAGLSAEGAELRAMENRISWSLRRRDDRWLIVHEHSSSPADFKTMKVSLNRDGTSAQGA
jgi:uncharacterized protein (TIGR02246 family)